MKKVAIFLINIYQKTLSPDHGPLKKIFSHGFCRFNPTCSQYTKESIDKYGFIKGFFLGFWRINRCNPWSMGGNDYPQDSKPAQAYYGALALLIYIAVFSMLLLLFSKLLKGA